MLRNDNMIQTLNALIAKLLQSQRKLEHIIFYPSVFFLKYPSSNIWLSPQPSQSLVIIAIHLNQFFNIVFILKFYL